MPASNEAFVEARSSEVVKLMAAKGVPSPVAFDPATLLLIAKIIMEVFAMLKECSFFGPVEEQLKNPGLFARVRVSMLVSRRTRRTKLDRHSDAVMAALLESAKTVTAAQAKAMLDAD